MRMSAMNVGPLSCDKNMLVAFASGQVEIPTTAAVIEHPKQALDPRNILNPGKILPVRAGLPTGGSHVE